jgi:phosphatidylinositol alpha-1,6-mannosyltransferase
MRSLRSVYILALVTDAFGGRGGIAQYNRDLLSAFAELESVSSVMVLPRYAPDQSSWQRKIRQFRARGKKLQYIAAAVWVSWRNHVDLIFCGHLYVAPLAWIIARLKGAKLIIQMHGIEAWGAPSSLQRLAVDAADLVLCVSRHTRSSVLNWASIAPERVIVVPNTVGEKFKPDHGISSRKTWGLSGKRVLLTVGRMDSRERYKGHDRVIAAIPQLVAEGHDVVYLILGEGDDRARLEAIARKAGIIDRMRFMGLVSQELLVEAYRIADLFIMPSTGEGFGIAFLEAMASGTPAVGLAVAGAMDALADGELGIAVEESELPAVLCQALLDSRPQPEALATAVHARFGRECFASRARAVLKLCSESATQCEDRSTGIKIDSTSARLRGRYFSQQRY